MNETALAVQLNELNLATEATANPLYGRLPANSEYQFTNAHNFCITTPQYTYGYYQWYPTYWYSQPSRIEQAFRIVNVLLERKLITLKTIAQFTSLVDEIAKIV